MCAPIDANGTLTADGTRTFEWDAWNQLVGVHSWHDPDQLSLRNSGAPRNRRSTKRWSQAGHEAEPARGCLEHVESVDPDGHRHEQLPGDYFPAYCSSVTRSPYLIPVPKATPNCVNGSSGAAPCQCIRPAGVKSVSPFFSSRMG